MILSIFTSYPIPPRLIKISNLYDDDVKYISWNRKKYVLKSNFDINETVFDDSKRGKIKQYTDIIKFRCLVKNQIEELKPQKIICRNWKTFLIIRTIKIKESKIIYDVCDVPNHLFIRLLEKILISKRIDTILASRFFAPYYKKNARILENRISTMIVKQKIETKKLRISYLGVIRYTENLINLIKACEKNDNVELYIYGYGDSLQAIYKYKETNSSKVILCGEFKENDIPEIYSKTDVVWCAYPYKLYNVKIAISNKFFETIAFKTPGIFSKQTMLANLVAEKNIELLKEEQKLIDSISNNKKLIQEKVDSIATCNEKVYWEDYKEEV